MLGGIAYGALIYTRWWWGGGVSLGILYPEGMLDLDGFDFTLPPLDQELPELVFPDLEFLEFVLDLPALVFPRCEDIVKQSNNNTLKVRLNRWLESGASRCKTEG